MVLLTIQTLVANGGYSSVYTATRQGNNAIFALKVYDRTRCRQSPDMLRRAVREKHALELVAMLPHPFLVGYQCSYVDDQHVYLVMEQVGGGDLFNVLQTRGPLQAADARCHLAEVCLALGHLHSMDITYRNLKPENVLIGLDGHAKLSDLGLAYKLPGRIGSTPPPASCISLNGTPEYTAPEVRAPRRGSPSATCLTAHFRPALVPSWPCAAPLDL